ncbi:MAG: type II secretion system F family protein [Planctomycetota bacterium]
MPDNEEQQPERLDESLRHSLKEQLENRLRGEKESDTQKRRGRSQKGGREKHGSVLKSPIGSLFGHTSIRDITTFCEELALLLDAGLALVPAMRTLADRAANYRLGKMVHDMADRIESGASFTEAAAVYSGEFGNLFVSIFRAGERSGTLADAVRRVADRGERIMETRHRLLNILMYPAIIILVAMGVIGFAFSYTVSTFRPLLEELGGGIPWTMGLLLDAGDTIRDGGFWVSGASVVVVLTIIYLVGSQFSAFRLVRDRLLIRLPFVQRFVKKSLVANFSRVFSTMIHAGVPLPEALQATRETTNNEVVRLAVDRTEEAVREGQRIVPPLEKEKIFPPLAYDMMEVGEETGELDHVFGRIATIYEQRLANELETMGKLVQPTIIVILAVIVGFIVVAMFHTYATLLTEVTTI